MNNSNTLSSISPSSQGGRFGFERHQLTNPYDNPIIDSTTGFLYILDDVSCNAKNFSVKVFNQDFEFQNSFQIPESLHSIAEDKGYASFDVNANFVYFLNRTTLSIVDKYNFNIVSHSVVNSLTDTWSRVFVGEENNVCLHRTTYVPCKAKRLEMLILTDIKYAIRKRFNPENIKLSFISLAYNSVFVLQENFNDQNTNLLEISFDSKEIRSISLGYTNEVFAFTITGLNILLLTADSVLSVFNREGRVGKKVKQFYLQSLQTDETDKMVYHINFDKKTNSLFVYSPFYINDMLSRYSI